MTPSEVREKYIRILSQDDSVSIGRKGRCVMLEVPGDPWVWIIEDSVDNDEATVERRGNRWAQALHAIIADATKAQQERIKGLEEQHKNVMDLLNRADDYVGHTVRCSSPRTHACYGKDETCTCGYTALEGDINTALNDWNAGSADRGICHEPT